MFQDSLTANLLRLIQKMKPKTTDKSKSKKKKKKKEKAASGGGGGEWGEEADRESEDVKIKKKMFPGLAIPDDPSARVSVPRSRHTRRPVSKGMCSPTCLLKTNSFPVHFRLTVIR